MSFVAGVTVITSEDADHLLPLVAARQDAAPEASFDAARVMDEAVFRPLGRHPKVAVRLQCGGWIQRQVRERLPRRNRHRFLPCGEVALGLHLSHGEQPDQQNYPSSQRHLHPSLPGYERVWRSDRYGRS